MSAVASNPISDYCARFTGDLERHGVICYNVTAAMYREPLDEKCWTCRKTIAKISECVCHVAIYCGKECQKADQKTHQPECDGMKKISPQNSSKAVEVASNIVLKQVGLEDEKFNALSMTDKLKALKEQFMRDSDVSVYFFKKIHIFRAIEQKYWGSQRANMFAMGGDGEMAQELYRKVDEAHLKITECLNEADASYIKLLQVGDDDQKLLRQRSAETDACFIRVHEFLRAIRRAEVQFLTSDPTVALLKQTSLECAEIIDSITQEKTPQRGI